MIRLAVCMALTLTPLLAACGQKTLVPTTVVQQVPTTVAVACLKPGERPAPPTRLAEDQPEAPSTLTEIVGRLRAKLKEWQDGYGVTADRLLRICEAVPQPKGPGL